MLRRNLKYLRKLFTRVGPSQAALEFIMTYGWAILVVLISVAVLAYFGVLSPDTFLPHKCTLPSGIVCLDYKVESYKVTVVFQNSLGETMTINKVTVSGNNQDCSDNQSITLLNSEKAVFAITQCNNGQDGKKFNGVINISYSFEDKLSHEVSGTLKARVVHGDSVSSQSVCQNAENNGLCDGLDLVFGEGYKSACCNEHNLCCT